MSIHAQCGFGHAFEWLLQLASYFCSEHAIKALPCPGGLFVLWSLRGGVNREGGLVLPYSKNLFKMVFCIPSALLPLKS